MEGWKEKIPFIISIAILIIAGAITIYFLENHETVYYSQIDNSKLEMLSATDNMKSQYTLDAYNENGRKKKQTFKASRELKQGAYIKLEVRTLGVHAWEEVQYNELPQKVQEKYQK